MLHTQRQTLTLTHLNAGAIHSPATLRGKARGLCGGHSHVEEALLPRWCATHPHWGLSFSIFHVHVFLFQGVWRTVPNDVNKGLFIFAEVILVLLLVCSFGFRFLPFIFASAVGGLGFEFYRVLCVLHWLEACFSEWHIIVTIGPTL